MIANPVAHSVDDDALEIPHRVGERIATWWRALHHAEHENKVKVFRYASRELQALAMNIPPKSGKSLSMNCS